MTHLICKQISKKTSFFSFLTKGQEGCYFFKGGQQGRYSFYERTGRAQCPSETIWGKL